MSPPYNTFPILLEQVSYDKNWRSLRRDLRLPAFFQEVGLRLPNENPPNNHGKPMVNSPLIKPYFLAGYGISLGFP